jgi:hypothetical protein
LEFLKIKSDDLLKCLSENFTSIYKENPNVEQAINRIDTYKSILDDIEFIDISKSLIKKQNTSAKKIKILQNLIIEIKTTIL